MPLNGQNFLKNSALQIPPKTSEIEISVFGRGYGECIVLHCGNNEFIVVDSFINAYTKNPICLDYLSSMGIPSTSIKRVVVTHWHKDHIEGIDKVLEQSSPDAKIVLSPIIREEKFHEYLQLGISEGNESTSVFAKVYDYIEKTGGQNVVLATQHARIYCNEKMNNAEIHTLSPQDSDLFKFLKNIILPAPNQPTSYSLPDDNLLSLVLLLKKDSEGILMGGDLESTGTKNMDWDAVVENYEHTNTYPSIFKLPHHGSWTGHNDRVWKEILSEFPISIATAFNKGKKLPMPNDIERIKKFSKSLYVVGNKGIPNKELQNKAKKVLGHNANISAINTNIGLFRYRKDLVTGKYNIETFGAVNKYETKPGL